MAQQFLSVGRGVFTVDKVAVATSAPAADFYLQILSTNAPTRKDTLLALELFKQFILSNALYTGIPGDDIPVL